jgi:hypothetical protein
LKRRDYEPIIDNILVILAQIINFLNDFQESFNFDATIQSFAQPLCAKELPQPGV